MHPGSAGPVVPAVAAAVGWVVAYVVWSAVYYRVVDPWLRLRVGARLGRPVMWVYRRGSLYEGSLSFRLPYSTWSWGIFPRPGGGGQGRPAVRESVRDGIAYAAYVITVPVLAGILPIVPLMYAVLWRRAMPLLVAYPLLFLIIPLYMRYWGGRRRVKGMEPAPAD